MTTSLPPNALRRYGPSQHSYPETHRYGSYTYTESLYNTVIALIGPEQERFVLHQALVCGRSKRFKTACAEPGEHEKVVTLPNVEVKIFEAYRD